MELTEWLAITARFNGGTFVEGFMGVSHEQFDSAHQKKQADRTEVGQKFFDLWQHHYSNHNRTPILDFADVTAVRGSFRYLGKGVKLGAADRIVCWYKPKKCGEISGHLWRSGHQGCQLPGSSIARIGGIPLGSIGHSS